jgi:branched-chain amino acid aminotransferase
METYLLLQPHQYYSKVQIASLKDHLIDILSYATECFEGMKMYRGYDGKLRLFRPDCNCQRMLISATRIALPAFDPKELEKLIIALIAVDGPK